MSPSTTPERARDPTARKSKSAETEAQPVVFPASEARAHFMEVISRVRFGRERLVITNKGKAAAALVTMEDLRLLQLLDDVDIQEKLYERLAQNKEDAGSIELDDYLT